MALAVGLEHGDGPAAHLVDLARLQRLGAIVSKGTTLHPRRGNQQRRIVETPAGMLNSIGLQNIGVEALIRDIAPIWETWQTPVIVNIAGHSVDDYARLAERLDETPGVSGLELNISCPNVENGLEFGSDPEAAAAVTEAVVRHTTLPIIAPSLGGAETLLTRPALTSHAGMDPEQRRRAGISDGLIRMSVGLESPDEIVDDLLQALETAAVSKTL